MDPAKLKAATDFLTANGIVTRAQWKARASKIDASKPENLDWNYNTLVIHHSGRSGETDPVKVQNKHMDVRKWDDVGYHFMVHPDGTIYEGRGLVFKGSHVELANTGKVGILVMGNFETLIFGLGASDPTVQQMEAVKRLGKALIKLFSGIKVLGGHKDWKKSTECPGNKLYPRLDEFRTALGSRPLDLPGRVQRGGWPGRLARPGGVAARGR
jgi:hypothetical protein